MEVLKHCIKMEGKEVPSNKVGFLNFHSFVRCWLEMTKAEVNISNAVLTICSGCHIFGLELSRKPFGHGLL